MKREKIFSLGIMIKKKKVNGIIVSVEWAQEKPN